MPKPRPPIWKILLDGLPVPAALFGFGVYLWRSTGAVFYLFNFGYIALSILAGGLVWELAPRAKKHWGRRMILILVGGYMIGYLGIAQQENMQLEGFWLYLLSGLFAGSVIHYAAAKVVGPLLFGRGWCGWMCWTVAVLDFLPWRRSPGRLPRRWGFVRHGHFLVSLGVVAVAWLVLGYRVDVADRAAELWWLVAGNVLYWGAAVALAARLKDNRAFCKYLCPIPVILKVPARFSLMKVEGDRDRCDACGACDRVCPMDLQVSRYVAEGIRVGSTECVLCNACQNACPREALKTTTRPGAGGPEYLRERP
jgi:ferredoxin-type protein NapH